MILADNLRVIIRRPRGAAFKGSIVQEFKDRFVGIPFQWFQWFQPTRRVDRVHRFKSSPINSNTGEFLRCNSESDLEPLQPLNVPTHPEPLEPWNDWNHWNDLTVLCAIRP